VVYTGTHDNDTTRGWYENSSTADERDFARRYLGSDGRDIVWDLIRLAYESAAERAIVPLQDVLELGSEARMNLPGRASGNWAWRFDTGDLTEAHARRLRDLAAMYGRVEIPAD
jgi:4-alpha-glucanotransferase